MARCGNSNACVGRLWQSTHCISYVGKAHVDVSGLDFKHGDLVNTGHKGVWVMPLYPGKHPVNTRVMKVDWTSLGIHVAFFAVTVMAILLSVER